MARLTNKCRECQLYKPRAEFHSTTETGIFSRVCSTCLQGVKCESVELSDIGDSFTEDLEAARNADTLLTFESDEPVQLNKYRYEVSVPAELASVFDLQDSNGAVQKQFIQEKILSQIQGVYNFVYKKFTKTPTGATVNYMCIHDHYIYNLRCKCRKKRVSKPGKISAQSLLCKGCLYVYFNSEQKTMRIEHRHMHHVEKNSTSGLSLTQRKKIIECVENSSPTDHLYTNAVFEEIMEKGSTVKKDSIFRAIRRAVERKSRNENPILNFLSENILKKSHLLDTHYLISTEHLGFVFLSKEKFGQNKIKNLFICSNEEIHGESITIIAAYDVRSGAKSVPVAYTVMFKRVRKRRSDCCGASGSIGKPDLKSYKVFVDQTISALESSDVEAHNRTDARRISRVTSRPGSHDTSHNTSHDTSRDTSLDSSRRGSVDTSRNSVDMSDDLGSPSTIDSEDQTMYEDPDNTKAWRNHTENSRRTDERPWENSKFKIMQWFLQLLKAQDIYAPSCVSCEAKTDQIQAVSSVFGDEVPIKIHLERVKADVVEQMSSNERLNESAFDEYFKTAPFPHQIKYSLCWSNMQNVVCDCEKLKPCPRTHRGVLERYYTHLSKDNIEMVKNMIDSHSKYSFRGNAGDSRPISQHSLVESENICIQEALQWCIANSAYSRWIYLWKTWYSDDKRKLWMRNGNSENVPLKMELSDLDKRIQRNEFSAPGSTEGELGVSGLIRDLLSALSKSLTASSLEVDIKQEEYSNLNPVPSSSLSHHSKPFLTTRIHNFDSDVHGRILAFDDIQSLGLLKTEESTESFDGTTRADSPQPDWDHDDLLRMKTPEKTSDSVQSGDETSKNDLYSPGCGQDEDSTLEDV